MEIILGRYLKAIEEEVMRRIGEAKKSLKKTIVLVPSQASFLMEKKIIERFGGFCSIEVMSFEKLTQLIFERTSGRALSKVDSIGVGIRVRRALEENAQKLKLFRTTNDDEIHMRLASSISSMYAEDITPESLRQLAQNKQGQLAQKLDDIALVYEEVLKNLEGVLTPQAAERYAANMVLKSDFIKDARVIIHGFELFSMSKLHMISELIAAGCDVSVTLEADEKDDVFYHQNMAKVKLENAARIAGKSVRYTYIRENTADISPDIAYLEDALYSFLNKKSGAVSPENIGIVCARDWKDEADFIADRILKETSKGTALRDIGIMVPGEVPQRLKEALGLAGIVYAADTKRKLVRHRLCAFVLYAVKLLCSSRWKMSDIFGFLKTKIALSSAETDALVEYLESRGIKGKMCARPLEDEDIEPLRARAFELIAFYDAKREDTAKLCISIREYLQSSDIEQKLEAEALMLEREGKLEEARFTSQVFCRVCELLTSTAGSARGMDKALLYPLLLCGFSAAELSIVPPSTNEVVIGDITHAIFSRKKLMIVAGANDGALPCPPPSGIFTVDELKSLNEDVFFPGLSLGEDQRIYIRRALSCADKLIVTFNERTGLPSTVIERMLRIFEGLKIRRTEEFLPCSRHTVSNRAAHELRRAVDDKNCALKCTASLVRLKGDDDILNDIVRAVAFENRPKRPSSELCEKLYGRELKSSVTRIEKFQSCPYRHFIEYGLRPKVVKQLDEDSAMAGSYVHEMMDCISKGIRGARQDWAEVSDERIHELAERTAQRLRPVHNAGYFSTDKRASRMEKRLREETEFAAKVIRSHLKGSAAKVEKSELNFGGKGELTVGAERGSIDIHGKIDRVDIAVAEDGSKFLRIVDYKTGNKSYSITEVFYGISIQLIVYMMAALAIYKDCLPAGGFYFHIDMPFSKYTDDKRFMDMRMNGFLVDDRQVVLLFDRTKGDKLISMSQSLSENGVKGAIPKDDMDMLMRYVRRLISTAVREIFSGADDITPYYESEEKNACKHCDYRPICRFDELYLANCRVISKRKDMEDIRKADGR